MSPRKTPDDDKTRFTLWLPAGMNKELEKLQGELGKLSVSEVVREGSGVVSQILPLACQEQRLPTPFLVPSDCLPIVDSRHTLWG